MRALRLVREDEVPFYEDATIEVDEADIACAEPAEESRPLVRAHYDQVNVFLGQYLKLKRGETLVVSAPPSLAPGDLLDVEIAVGDHERVVLHGQVGNRWPLCDSALAEVHFLTGRMTDRRVAKLAESLGSRHAARLLGLTSNVRLV